ncbi:hypothetical protein KVQ82_21810 [Pseudomonas sp. AO-1]|uniref:hypothetical protein n=1 Tax=Pseudomonas sp. AO-1 TaxID=2855434 RepID=UPI001C74CE34|nr:hypothetical protein [Pseudomonas sp. AO-1]QXZ12694.1 hypothetical protein KVQ82_21810 [Pseudomonas sp. AO-1]
MNSPNTLFEAPFLKNTLSPNIVTYAEYESGDTYVMANYPGKKGDELAFYLVADGTFPIIKKRILGSDREDHGIAIDPANDWELVGKQIYAFITVFRDSKFLGFSALFSFTILAE